MPGPSAPRTSAKAQSEVTLSCPFPAARTSCSTVEQTLNIAQHQGKKKGRHSYFTDGEAITHTWELSASTASPQVLLQQGSAQEPLDGSCLVPSCWLRMKEAAWLSAGGFTGAAQGCAGWEGLLNPDCAS